MQPCTTDVVAVMPSVATTAASQPVARTHPGVSQAATDIDGDGRSDIWLDDVSHNQMSWWLMSGPMPVFYRERFSTPHFSRRVAQGDLNGDGRLDVVWKAQQYDYSLKELVTNHFVWLGGASGFTGANIPKLANGWSVVGVGDTDGDGRGDLLVSNGVNIAYWRMDGGNVLGYSPQFPIPAGRALAAHGDFNADGRLDLVWANTTGRTLVLWQGNAAGGFNELPIREYAPGWRVWGAGDIDGDRRADLLLTHPTLRMFAYWRMDGAVPTGFSPAFKLPGQGPSDTYGPIAVGDYNGDHRLDVLLERSTDRTLLMWQGDGNGFQQLPVRDYAPDWRVMRPFGKSGTLTGPYVASDMDGDGRSDALVFGIRSSIDRYVTPGEFRYEKLAEIPHGIRATSLGCSGARILASGYFDADHIADIVAADNCGAGRVYMRLGARAIGVGAPEFEDITIQAPAAGWSIIGARDVDGDGLDDLLLGENYNSGARSMSGFAYWVMSGPSVVRYSPGFLPSGDMRVLAAKGDFNGDGKLDLVWSTGGASRGAEAMRMWLGDGLGFTSHDLPSTAPFWGVAAAGDVNGDGRSDLVLQNTDGPGSYMAYWIMDGPRPTAYSPALAREGSIHDVADYNGDDRADVLLSQLYASNQSSTSYTYTVWAGTGEAFRRSHALWESDWYGVYSEARTPR